MKFPLSLMILCALWLSAADAQAQKRRSAPKAKFKSTTQQTIKPAGNSAVVIDETLAVLRARPSLFAESVQRMRRGRTVQILGERETEGVKFYRVSAPPNRAGWIQSDALFGGFRRGDDERLARLIQASSSFEQLEIAAHFLKIYPRSPLRPAILLLFGDLAEDAAAALSRTATRRLSRREMAATGAPLHSYYLNFVSLDRYRKLGIVFLFNLETKTFHYEGASWREILKGFPSATETAEARKRLDSLKEKLAGKP